jgi:hypothetical protein
LSTQGRKCSSQTPISCFNRRCQVGADPSTDCCSLCTVQRQKGQGCAKFILFLATSIVGGFKGYAPAIGLVFCLAQFYFYKRRSHGSRELLV